MGNPITAQFVGDHFPGLGYTTAYQLAEKPLGSTRSPSTLQKNIYDIPILGHPPPQIMVFAPTLRKASSIEFPSLSKRELADITLAIHQQIKNSCCS